MPKWSVFTITGAVADLSFGYGVNNYVFLYGVNCVGTETRLIDCSQGSYTGCTSQDAGVRCLNGLLLSLYYSQLITVVYLLQLRVHMEASG